LLLEISRSFETEFAVFIEPLLIGLALYRVAVAKLRLFVSAIVIIHPATVALHVALRPDRSFRSKPETSSCVSVRLGSAPTKYDRTIRQSA
jgi:hypothetical protein